MGNIWCIGQRLDSLVTNSVVSTSSDGINWNNVNASTLPFDGRQTGSTLTWYNNVLVATSTLGSISVTTNYIDWIKGNIGVEGFAITGMAAPPSYTACGRRHYIKAQDGFAAGTEVAQIFKSTTGYPGTYAMIFSTGNNPSGFNNIKYFPEADIGTGTLVPVLIAVGNYSISPYAIYSVNGGNTWNNLQIDNDLFGPFYDVEYNPSNKRWYFGSKNSIAIADQLISPTWTTTILFGDKLSEVTKLKLNPDGQMVAVTPSKLWWSENLENWNNFEAPGYSWQNIYWYNNRWIASAYSQLTQHTFWFSMDMTTWFPENNYVQAAGFAVSEAPNNRFWLNILGGPGNDYAFGNFVDSSGNNYAFGTTDEGAGGLDFSFSKYDTAGNLIWQKTIGSSNNESGNSISVNTTGNIFSVGSTLSSGEGLEDISIIKYNQLGNIEWQKTLGGTNTDIGYGIISPGSNVYICGTTESITPSIAEGVLIQYSSDGTLQWQKSLSDGTQCLIRSITSGRTSNIYICGTSNSHIFTSKLTYDGNIIWQKELGFQNDTGYGITSDLAGNVYVCGSTTFNDSTENAILAKYSSDGILIWQKILGGAGIDIWKGVVTDTENNIYTTGYTTSEGTGGNDILIAKYSSNGTLIWQRTLGGTGVNDSGYSIKINQTNDIYITGTTDSRGGSFKSIVAKLPSNGSLTGAYSEYIYRISNISSYDGELISTNSNLVITPSALTENSSTLIDTSSTFTNITYILG